MLVVGGSDSVHKKYELNVMLDISACGLSSARSNIILVIGCIIIIRCGII